MVESRDTAVIFRFRHRLHRGEVVFASLVQSVTSVARFNNPSTIVRLL